jgi:AraC family transcriptional regulator of arabinose operon
MAEDLPRTFSLPTPDRPHWRTPGLAVGDHDLQYLAWGERRYGETPMPCARHYGWVYAVVERGAPTLVTPTARYRLAPRCALVLGPDFGFGWSDTGRRSCRIVLWMWRCPATPLLPAAQLDFFQQTVVDAATLARLQLVHSLCREQVQSADRATPAALAGLHQVLEATMVRTATESEPDHQRTTRLEFAVRWMESHFDSRQPVARLADYLGVSASTLRRLVKGQFGCSPDEHFLRLKMALAKRELAAGAPVKAVAFRLGYKHPGDLSRAFRRHVGASPTAAILSQADAAGRIMLSRLRER